MLFQLLFKYDHCGTYICITSHASILIFPSLPALSYVCVIIKNFNPNFFAIINSYHKYKIKILNNIMLYVVHVINRKYYL